jgi:hypothetical protein
MGTGPGHTTPASFYAFSLIREVRLLIFGLLVRLAGNMDNFGEEWFGK